MRSEVIILLLVLAAGAIYYFVILPEQEKKKSWNKEAAAIAQQFGSGSVSLYKFPTSCDKRGAGYVYALLNISDYQSWLDTEKVTSYHVLLASYEKGDVNEKYAMKKINYLRGILPYNLNLNTATMDFAKWERRVLDHPCRVTCEYY